MDTSYSSNDRRFSVVFNGESIEQRTAVINNLGRFMPGLQEYSASPQLNEHEISVGLPFCPQTARFILEKALLEVKNQF